MIQRIIDTEAKRLGIDPATLAYTPFRRVFTIKPEVLRDLSAGASLSVTKPSVPILDGETAPGICLVTGTYLEWSMPSDPAAFGLRIDTRDVLLNEGYTRYDRNDRVSGIDDAGTYAFPLHTAQSTHVSLHSPSAMLNLSASEALTTNPNTLYLHIVITGILAKPNQ